MESQHIVLCLPQLQEYSAELGAIMKEINTALNKMHIGSTRFFSSFVHALLGRYSQSICELSRWDSLIIPLILF